MNDNGWIKLYRELIDKPIWINSTPEQNRILITLLCMANHKPGTWIWKGEQKSVNAGQFITSVQSIIDKCKCKNITRQKVRTALKNFEKYGFLTTETDNQSTLITIVNWQYYQEKKAENNQQINQQLTNEQPTANQQLTTNKNKEYKNVKNDKNNIYAQNSDELFSQFWEAYPKKRGKSNAYRSWGKLKISNELFNLIMQKLELFKKSDDWLKDNGQYIPYPATFLNGRRWEDEIETDCGNTGKDSGVVL